MDASELIRRYAEGVRFECGCTEKGLHPAVEQALLAGRITTSELLHCPIHWAPMAEGREEPLPPGEPLLFS